MGANQFSAGISVVNPADVRSPVSVLVVDDEPDVREVFTRLLRRAGYAVMAAGTAGEALQQVRRWRPQVVLLDQHLPDQMGEAVLTQIRADPSNADIAVLMVSGDDAVDHRVAGLRGGADDYLAKPVSAAELIARIDAQIRIRRAQGVDGMRPTRQALAERLAGIEVDGNLDVVLRTIAGMVADELAAGPVSLQPVPFTGVPLASTGGERTLRWGARVIPTLGAYLEREPEGMVLHLPLRVRGEAFAVLSVDVGARPEAAAAVLTDLAPQLGLMLHPLVRDERHAARDRDEVAALLRPGAIHPVFQPLVDLRTGAVIGFEGLSRFADGIRPDLRFRQASALGLRGELEVAAICALLEGARCLPAGSVLTLNVSVHTLLTEDLAPILAGSGRPLVLEITEHEIIADYAAVAAAFDRLDGVGLGVDDAGSGYASLRHIYELRPQLIKLDRGWVTDLHLDAVRRSLVRAICSFAEELHASVLGEGVEQQEEHDALSSLGVALGQGYLFGRPAPAEHWRG